MDKGALEGVSGKLDIIVKLLAANATKGLTLKEQIALLHNVGLAPKDIASILGRTQTHVNKELVYLRKQNKVR